MKLIFVALAVAAMSGTTRADIFDSLAKEPSKEQVQKDAARVDYYSAMQAGKAPSVESVRDFVLPKWLDDREVGELKREPYFRLVLPYFFAGLQGKGFAWTNEAIQIVESQRRWCLDKKDLARQAAAEVQLLRRSAPVDQYGQRVEPWAAEKRLDAIQGGIAGICIGVDPSRLYGNQVWDALQANNGPQQRGGF